MKKIMIPYDFSETSENVLNYGLGLANEISAGIVLLHIIPYPVVTPESGLPAFSYDDMKKDTLKELRGVADKIKSANPGLSTVECFTDMGDVTESIVDYCKKHPVEFVVMGINQHNTKLMKVLMGSNAVETAHKTKCTVIIVPPGIAYKKPANIAFASGHTENSEDASLQKAKDISNSFGAQLQVLHVVPENHHFAPAEMVLNNYFEHKREKQEHKLFIVTEKKISEGLLSMLGNELIDMIIIEPKEHSLFYKLFHESISREVAFSSPVPVILMHS